MLASGSGSRLLCGGRWNGRSLLVYSRLVPDSDFGNYQVRFQILNSSTPGDDGGMVLDAGMDRATDASDGGVVLTDGSSSDAGWSFEGAASDADANPTGPVDASGGDLLLGPPLTGPGGIVRAPGRRIASCGDPIRMATR